MWHNGRVCIVSLAYLTKLHGLQPREPRSGFVTVDVTVYLTSYSYSELEDTVFQHTSESLWCTNFAHALSHVLSASCQSEPDMVEGSASRASQLADTVPSSRGYQRRRVESKDSVQSFPARGAC